MLAATQALGDFLSSLQVNRNLTNPHELRVYLEYSTSLKAGSGVTLYRYLNMFPVLLAVLSSVLFELDLLPVQLP